MTDAEKAQMLRDEVAELTAVIDTEGLMSTGAAGQVVAHPCLAQRRASLALLIKLEGRMTDSDGPDALDRFLAGP